MKKVFIISMLLIISICSIFLFLNKQEEQILIQDDTAFNSSSLAVYLENEDGEYESSSTIPLKDDGYVFSNAVCENDVEVKWNEEAWSIIVPDAFNFRCNLYFDKKASAKDTLLANYPTVLTRTDFSTTVTNTTTGTIYKSADSSQYDEDGEVYYFAGNPTDNWVYFAGYYWRIIRINGDGSIRLIYSGDGSPQTTWTDTTIGSGRYNTYSSSLIYVNYGESEIKENLDNWYNSKIQNTEYSNYVDANAGFCNDKTIYSESSPESHNTIYNASYRLTNHNPTLKCTNIDDLYTLSNSDKGNKALTYPVGLITADEVAYAGGVTNIANTSFYLHTGQNYWTMTPSYFFYSAVAVLGFLLNMDGYISANQVSNYGSNGIRPVINLRSDVTLTGSGTSTDPYVVS